MLQKLNNLKTPARIAVEAALVVIIATASIFAYAAISSWINGDKDTNVEIGDVFSGRIEQIDVTGKVSPGDTIAVHPSLSNTGNVPALGFVKLTYPMYTPSGSSSTPIYTWTVNSGWKVVETGAGYTVYGYTTPLNYGESTTELCNGMVLKDLSYEELLGVGDINVNIGYWLGNCNDVGEDVDVAWENRE